MTSPFPPSPATVAPLPKLGLGLADLAPHYDLILCDVWGVVHNGVRHHRPAVDALRKYRAGGGTVILVTNAPAPREQVRRRLESLDVPADAYDGIATSGDVTIAMIVAAGCPPVFNIGPRAEIALYREAGRLGPRTPEIVSIDRAALAVCIGLDATGDLPEDYDDILAGLRKRDLDLICANPDIVVEVGTDLVYCAGAIAARYEAMGGTVRQAGKPFPAIYELAISEASSLRGEIPARRILAIGDAMHTDMKGATAQGIAGLMVTSGIHRDDLHGGDAAGDIDIAALELLIAKYETRPFAAIPALSWRP